MDETSEDNLREFFSEASFESQGEFDIDLARAEEKTRQHLGIWPEDYLAFLIQGAYGLGAPQLRLSTSWRSLIWEFDGAPLTALQLGALNPQSQHGQLTGPLKRLRLALYLLLQSRYPAGRWSCESMALVWRRGQFKVVPTKNHPTSVHRIELYLPASRLSLGWLLTRNALLSTLPEYAAVRKRLRASPIQLRLPWPEESPRLMPQPFPLAVALQGSLARPHNPPLPSLNVVERTWDLEESCWFVASDRSTLQCLIHGLAYPAPSWGMGACWIYCERLKMDLGQRNLNQNKEFEALLQQVRGRLAEILVEILQDPEILQSCRPWILRKITQRLEEGLPLGFLGQIPLFESIPNGPLQLAELHQIYQKQGQRLYFVADLPPREPPPPELPPVVIVSPENASILRLQFTNLMPAEPLYHEYQQRHLHKQAWLQRPEEPLEIPGLEFAIDLQQLLNETTWRGQVGLRAELAAPTFELFCQQRRVVQFTLPDSFPVGLCCRVAPPELAMNSSWTRPCGPQWDSFQRALHNAVGRWLLRLAPNGPEWLLERTYDLKPEGFFDAPLIAVGQQRFSLNQARQRLQEERLEQWILQGWHCQEDYARVLAALDQSKRLARLVEYHQHLLRWQSQATSSPTLEGDSLCKQPLPGQKGEIAFSRQEIAGAQLTSYREGRRIATQLLEKSLPAGLVIAYDHPYFFPNLDWSGVTTQGLAWQDMLQDIQDQVPALLQALLKSKEPRRNLLVLRLFAWLPHNRWPPPRALAGTHWFQRLDGSPLPTPEALAQLDSGPPIQVVTPSETLRCRPELEGLWVVTQAELELLISLWGAGRIKIYQDELVNPRPDQVDLTHLLRSSLKSKPSRPGIPLPDLCYLAVHSSEQLHWGLQFEVGGVSRIRVLVKMKQVEVLSLNWLYQVQASVDLEDVEQLQLVLDKLCQQVEQTILQKTPESYRALLAFSSWQSPRPWHRLLQAESSLRDARGTACSPQHWINSWNPRRPAPYLLETDLGDRQMLEFLPDGPVVILSPAQVQAAQANLPSIVHYQKGLLKAWQCSHYPLYAGPDPSTVSYCLESPDCTILAEIAWTEQTIVFLWRGREVHRRSRPNWPGYELQVDYSQDLFEQPWPEWREWMPRLSPYFFYLSQFFKEPQLLEESRAVWESLPVQPGPGPIGLYLNPGEADVRNLLAQQKLLWAQRETQAVLDLREQVEAWLKMPVDIKIVQGPTDAPAHLERSLVQSSLLTLNQGHPWFSGQSPEIIALRLNLWLQSCGQIGWREACAQRIALLQQFSLLNPPEIA